MTTGENDSKAVLKRYLQAARDALLWKVEGLNERELRMPRTPTGTNLIGIVKHAANVEIGYFGATFGRVWPTDEAVPLEAYDADPQADFYLTEEETATGVVDFYRRVWTFADATIDELPLDARGRVAWWGDDEVTLERIIVHVTADLTRHAGHADILRELIDGEIGLNLRNPNVPEMDWPEYVAKLTALAESY